jgi:hypothetical protein
LVLELKARGQALNERLGFYVAAGLMSFVAVSGLTNSGLISMIRYMFCVHVMLALAAAHLSIRLPAPAGVFHWFLGAAFVAALLISLTFQIVLIGFYTHGAWVA